VKKQMALPPNPWTNHKPPPPAAAAILDMNEMQTSLPNNHQSNDANTTTSTTTTMQQPQQQNQTAATIYPAQGHGKKHKKKSRPKKNPENDVISSVANDYIEANNIFPNHINQQHIGLYPQLPKPQTNVAYQQHQSTILNQQNSITAFNNSNNNTIQNPKHHNPIPSNHKPPTAWSKDTIPPWLNGLNNSNEDTNSASTSTASRSNDRNAADNSNNTKKAWRDGPRDQERRSRSASRTIPSPRPERPPQPPPLQEHQPTHRRSDPPRERKPSKSMQTEVPKGRDSSSARTHSMFIPELSYASLFNDQSEINEQAVFEDEEIRVDYTMFTKPLSPIRSPTHFTQPPHIRSASVPPPAALMITSPTFVPQTFVRDDEFREYVQAAIGRRLSTFDETLRYLDHKDKDRLIKKLWEDRMA